MNSMSSATCCQGKKMASRGLCSNHYKMVLKRENPEYAKRQRFCIARWRKANPTAFKQWYTKNREKRIRYVHDWYVENKADVKKYDRKRNLLKTYGLKIEQYEKMLVSQNGLCAICKKGENGRELSVDHCHKTDIVRGLLCKRCNWAIGFFDDNAELLRSAIEYLEKLKTSPCS